MELGDGLMKWKIVLFGHLEVIMGNSPLEISYNRVTAKTARNAE